MESNKQIIRKTISPSDASLFKTQVIDKWRNKLEIWPFAYGDMALQGFASCGAAYTMFFYRSKLKLLRNARATSYLPVVVLSALFTRLYQEYHINYRILNKRSCSICTEVQAGLVQAITASAYPLVMSPIICFYFADRLLTYPVPPLTEAPGEVFQLWKKLTRPHIKSFTVICAIQIIAAVSLTHEKIKTFAKFDLLTTPV